MIIATLVLGLALVLFALFRHSSPTTADVFVFLVGLVFLLAPALAFVLYVAGGLPVFFRQICSVCRGAHPTWSVACDIRNSLGPELAFSALLLNVSAESLPMGSHTITLVPSNVTDDGQPSLVSLKHSRTYETPLALETLQKWLSLRSFS